MSTDIEGIKDWLVKNEMQRPRAMWHDNDRRFTVGEMKAALAALEQAEEERDAALDTLKRAQENWEKLATKARLLSGQAAVRLAEVEEERDQRRNERQNRY